MSKKIVTIHQPDFMPWLGFFVKINKADTYVVLDHVINKYNDQSWFRRVKLATKMGEFWLSISVKKPTSSSFIAINQMQINSNINYTKAIKTVEQIYTNTPFYKEIFPIVEEWFSSDETLLSIRNINFIKNIMSILDIDTEVVYSSQLDCKCKSNDLLIEILKSQQADIYLCGDGADGYQQDKLFLENNIIVEYNNFKPQEYSQTNTKTFQSGLSIIDILMNIGIEETKQLVRKG